MQTVSLVLTAAPQGKHCHCAHSRGVHGNTQGAVLEERCTLSGVRVWVIAKMAARNLKNDNEQSLQMMAWIPLPPDRLGWP